MNASLRGLLLALCTTSACSSSPQSAAPAPSAPAVTAPAAAPAPSAATPGTPAFRIVEDKRTPSARTADGCVVLELDRDWHSLRYRRGNAASCPTLAQSFGLLHQMLLGFEAMGDLQSTTSLELGRDYGPFYERLARAAAQSSAWDAGAGRPTSGNANAFVVQTAHDPARFFPEVVELLRGTKLSAELRSVEKVLIGHPSETPFASKLAAAGIAESAKLPYDCSFAFHLTPAQ